MDNAQKAIMIGVGLFITIIIIAAVMVVVGVSNDLLDNKNQEMVNASNAINYNSYAQYDEATLDGAKVIAMVKSLKNRENFVVEVNNGNVEADYGTSVMDSCNSSDFQDPKSAISISAIRENSDRATASKMSISSADEYINVNDKYSTHLLLISDKVVGVYCHIIE